MEILAIYPPVSTWPRTRVQRLLTPSLADCLFVAVLVWLFVAGTGWTALLADGDTGWHIRTGEYILDHGSIPHEDLFSFTRAGQPWFAWEWLSDICFALLHRAGGLAAVAAFTGLLLCAAITLLFRHMLGSGANVVAALGLTLAASGASSVHYLARPHIFTFLGLTISMWILDRDMRGRSRAVWWLVPLTAVWTNLHGGFLAWIACLALVTAGFGLQGLTTRGARRFARFRRYGVLLAACSAATLINPYGIRLHLHIVQYLRSPWIREIIQEFQSPSFRSENIFQFELLMFACLMLTPLLFRKGRFAEALLIVFWAHAALVSVRHVPVFAIVAAPILAVEASALWDRWTAEKPRRSTPGILRDLFRGFPDAGRNTLWIAAVLLALFCFRSSMSWPHDFPAGTFPVAALGRNPGLFAQPGRRILTTDQWGDYLIYRLYPRQKVFIDGRSDFYSDTIGRDYLSLFNVDYRWAAIVDRYGFDLAVLPVDMPLAQTLKISAGWRVRFDDGRTIVLERAFLRPEELNKITDSAEQSYGGSRQ